VMYSVGIFFTPVLTMPIMARYRDIDKQFAY
jgi:hypothetical protein